MVINAAGALSARHRPLPARNANRPAGKQFSQAGGLLAEYAARTRRRRPPPAVLCGAGLQPVWFAAYVRGCLAVLRPGSVHFPPCPATVRRRRKRSPPSLPRRVELARVLKKTGGTRSRIAGLRRLSPAHVTYLPACVRYVEMNPVRAGPCRRPEEHPWSSAAAHVSGQDDVLMQAGRLLDLVPSWAEHLSAATDEEMSMVSPESRNSPNSPILSSAHARAGAR